MQKYLAQSGPAYIPIFYKKLAMCGTFFFWTEFCVFSEQGGIKTSFFFSSALMDYAYGYPAMDKRRAPGRPSLQDYLKLAALQFELDNEEAENEIAPNEGMQYGRENDKTFELAISTTLLEHFAFFWYFQPKQTN